MYKKRVSSTLCINRFIISIEVMGQAGDVHNRNKKDKTTRH